MNFRNSDTAHEYWRPILPIFFFLENVSLEVEKEDEEKREAMNQGIRPWVQGKSLLNAALFRNILASVFILVKGGELGSEQRQESGACQRPSDGATTAAAADRA